MDLVAIEDNAYIMSGRCIAKCGYPQIRQFPSVSDPASRNPARDPRPRPSRRGRTPGAVARPAGPPRSISKPGDWAGSSARRPVLFGLRGSGLARGESVRAGRRQRGGKIDAAAVPDGPDPGCHRVGSACLGGTDPNTARGPDLRRLRARVGLVSQKHNLCRACRFCPTFLHGLLGKAPRPAPLEPRAGPARLARGGDGGAGPRRACRFSPLRRADRLSGGQSQRVAIARAIVGDPEVLFADEPCASLDPAAGEDVMDLFFRLVRDKGVTVVFTSHNVDHALRYGDRVLGACRRAPANWMRPRPRSAPPP